ncbi:hypothetical protein E4T52_04236 [Aureobasidium sp. EXF-3400]|nr:hypothetical protein E4T51_03162 [Aureobasidium sp. EXF-12344]KAI4780870.1 hypothetical protein E4T52_04236 [Aureobasidium sp. EXF-3400]
MQRASPSVASADMRPPPTKLPNVKKHRTSLHRGQTPSERSSTGSRSLKDLCFICRKESVYEHFSLVTCCKCKRKYHRGCSRAYIPRPCPLEWVCYLCNSDSTENMQPAAKRRKLESPVPATVAGPSRSVSQKLDQEDSLQTRKYDQLIGMALHDASDHCLGIEEVYEWVIDHISDYDTEDKGWKDGIWVALAENSDFVHQDGGPTGLWTFRDDASTRYTPRDQSVVAQSKAGASSQDIQDNHARTKQGGDPPKPLASEHGLVNKDSKPPTTPIGQTSTKLPIRAGSEITSTVPSTINDTIDMIDLTMDEDERLPPRADLQLPQRSVAEKTVISLLNETPQVISENNQRSSFVRFGEPTPKQKSSTPFVDHILENAPEGSLEMLSGTEKWKAAQIHINNLLGSPPRVTRPTDRAQTSVPRSLKRGPGLKSLSSQPPELVVVPSRENPDHGTNFSRGPLEPILLDIDDATHNKNSQQLAPVSTENVEQSDTINHDLEQQTLAPNDEGMLMDLDHPEESLKVNPDVVDPPESAQVSDDTINHIQSNLALHPNKASDQESQLNKSQSQERLSRELLRERLPQESPDGKTVREDVVAQEPITEELITEKPIIEKPITEESFAEPFAEEPFTEEPFVEERLANKTHTNVYMDSAAQTDSAAAPSLALGNITHISLEPQAPVGLALAGVRKTADSTTQTEHAPRPQAALPSRPVFSEVSMTTVQEETIDPSLSEPNDASLTREERLQKLLIEYMYPKQKRQSGQPQVELQEDPDPFFNFDHEAKMKEIRARPTRKQIFGKVALSRVAGNDALTKLNQIVLGKDRLKTIDRYKGYTKESMEEQKRLNSQEGYYQSLEELLNLPDRVVPLIHEQQLAFRDYAPAPNGSRRVPRAKHIFKLGPNARW